MDKIIITFTDLDGSFYADLEVPVRVKMRQMKSKILGTLEKLDPQLSFDEDRAIFLCNRTGKGIEPDETMEKAGVWSGDYVTVVEA